MSLLHQVLDILIGGLIAGLTHFMLNFAIADPNLPVTIGVILASMYYFSRNPWGASREQGKQWNERIDAMYERVLP
ncbi:hypothetical protein SAMN05216388_101690 [Halorientalis persicus]|uniref:Uncharacterized protein n=1 Tax=Halorientalis persicus TaxID=1367881 RepID=A0A1H8RJT9_9EURY|nr:hypothetical protein [Halorientalis persicus]SEO66655.1 hypothetical protein SAMN05216388_101690 [Halorientalis persicus]